MKKTYKVATRGSTLALVQTRTAIDFLSKAFPEADFEILEIKTTGDKRLEWSLEKAGGKGLFTKEIEDALLSGEADLAVHSAKDLPSENPEGLTIAATLPRDDSRDVLAIRQDADIPAIIASGSPRRRSQLKKMFPQAVWKEIRGNIETRLRKLQDSYADAGVLSAAALCRLNIRSFGNLKFKYLKVGSCVPAVGQGIIAVQCRKADAGMFSKISDANTALALELERTFLVTLGGGCQVAYAAHYDGQTFHIYHEICGYRKIDLDPGKPLGELKAVISETASELKDKI